ncbi:MAG: sensor signal transduction histidine kinase [Deltaproteobacteria bacterium]|nr:sensor signal transduction histidine kinase [Deltaproteobacteria bacterium]
MKPRLVLVSLSDVIIFLSALIGLYFSSLYSFLLFHSLVEMVSVVISGSIFVLAWNSRKIVDHPFFVVLGISYLFVGFLDLLHTLAYAGMGVFPQAGANLPTQLWIAARFLNSFSLFIALGFIKRQVPYPSVLFAYAIAVSILLTTLFLCNLFPDCYLEGVGLTPFKKISEYVISAIFVLTVPLLLKRRETFDPGVLRLLIWALILTTFSELAFTFYLGVYDFSNLIGHYFKVIAYYLIYKALIETGFVRPYNLLFRDLKNSEEELRRANDQLETRVQQRTAQLSDANRALQGEILERKRAEEGLAEAEKKYSRLVENSLTGIYINLDGRIVFANQRFAEIYGYAKEELEGIEILKLVHPEDRKLIEERRVRRLQGEELPPEYESRGLTRDGRTIWVSRRNTLISYRGKPAILGNIVETTQRKQMEQSLQESQKELRFLSSQLLTAQENERKWIAQELHDSIGQTLAAVKFSLERKISQMDLQKAPPGMLLENVLSLIQNGIDETRTIMMNLRPSILDDLGILATINWFCREFQRIYSHLQIHRDIRVEEKDIPNRLKIVIFRILQEGMNNISKHSRGNTVFLSLGKTPQTIELEIRDNGLGFSLETSPRGLGLSSMKERAELSGGTFILEAAIGQGTRLKVSWPLISSFSTV